MVTDRAGMRGWGCLANGFVECFSGRQGSFFPEECYQFSFGQVNHCEYVAQR